MMLKPQPKHDDGEHFDYDDDGDETYGSDT